MTSAATDNGYDPLDDFQMESMTYGDLTYAVYRSGSGPAVVVMPEMPGITPSVADFARKVRDRGLTVFVPSLFGTPGKPPSPGYIINSLAKGCIAKEFTALATNRPSPVTAWLTALARDAHAACGGPGVGTVGMCFTGSFALAMATDPSVVAPVASQPSLPLGLTPGRMRATGLTDEEAKIVVARAQSENLCAIGLRFTGDPAVKAQRFDSLRSLLGENFISVELDSSKGNQGNNRKGAHSVLTEDLQPIAGHPTQQALDDVLNFLAERLLPANGS